MKRLLSFFPLLSALVLVLLVSFSGDNNGDYPGGSPAGYTGSPGDGQNCQVCHGGSVSNAPGWITSNIPPTGYVPGNTYTITVTVSGVGKKGFEVSPQNPSGTQLGVLIAGPGTKLVGGTKYVTQATGSSSNPKSWDFNWTAPPPGAGEVTFYGAFTVSKPVTKLSTLVVQESTAMPLVVMATANPPLIFKGENCQLDAIATGGSGSYSYAWSSTPPGFTSTLRNPVVTPEVTTTYSVTVSDGSSTGSSSAMVTVQYHVGVTEKEGASLTISPNPASRQARVTIPGNGSTTLALYNLKGSLLRKWDVLPSGHERMIDVTGLTPGLYIITCTRAGEIFRANLIIK